MQSPIQAIKAHHEKRKTLKKGEKLPTWALVFYGVGAFALVMFLLCIANPHFADWFNGSFSQALRFLTAKLTGWIPFSLSELLIYLIVPVLIWALVIGMRKYSNTWKQTGIYAATLFSVVALIFSLFALTLGGGYHTSSLYDRLEIRQQTVDSENLLATTQTVRDKLNTLAQSTLIQYDTSDFSILPMTWNELQEEILTSYKTVSGEYKAVRTFRSNVKPVLLSEVMSLAHITGVYSFYTGEANLNARFTDYTVPFTMAHEMAHQRGFAREDEANFIAFLVCIHSANPYVRYSGYLTLYDYLLGALYEDDQEAYNEEIQQMDRKVLSEMIAQNKFFARYENSTTSKIAGAISDSVLKLQGTEGIKSYGLVVNLAIAYYQNGNP